MAAPTLVAASSSASFHGEERKDGGSVGGMKRIDRAKTSLSALEEENPVIAGEGRKIEKPESILECTEGDHDADEESDSISRMRGKRKCERGARAVGLAVSLCIFSSDQLVRGFLNKFSKCPSSCGIRALPKRPSTKEFFSKFWSILWKRRPWEVWWRANLLVILVVLLCDIVMVASSESRARGYRHGTAIFPLHLSNAAGLAFASRWEGSISVGNLVGFSLGRFCQAIWSEYRPLHVVHFLYYLLQAIIRVLEVQFGAYLLKMTVCKRGKRMPTTGTKKQAGWYLVSVFVVSLIFETLVSVVECASQLISWSEFGAYWSTWWLADLAGILTISPVLILALDVDFGCTPHYFAHLKAFNRRVQQHLQGRERLKFAILTDLTVFFICLVTFSNSFIPGLRPLPYLLYPLLVFALILSSKWDWAIVLAFVAFFCSWGAVHYHGSSFYAISQPSRHETHHLLLHISLFMSVLGSVSIFLAAALEEERQLTKQMWDRISRCETESDLEDEFQKLGFYKTRKKHSVMSESMILAFRAPINTILSLTDIFLKETSLSPQHQEDVKTVMSCADTLLQMLHHVTEVRKMESGQEMEIEFRSVPFNVRTLLQKNKRTFRVLALNKGITYSSSVADSVPAAVTGDPGKLQQIIVNLVTDALSRTRRGTVTFTVTVHRALSSQDSDSSTNSSYCSVREVMNSPWASKTGMVKLDTGWKKGVPVMPVSTSEEVIAEAVCEIEEVKSNTSPDSQEKERNEVHLAFEISDSGDGMSKEDISGLLNPLRQGSPVISRDRPGLHLVKELVEAQRGRIFGCSTLEKGTTILFVIPYPTVNESQVPSTSSPTGLGDSDSTICFPSGRKEVFIMLKGKQTLNILLVEENRSYRKVAEQQLKARGHKITTVKDGARAYDILLDNHDAFDLVLMDLNVSKTFRFDAPSMIREVEVERNWPRVPILGLTSTAIEDYRVALPTEDMDAYIGKPFDIDQFLRIINQLGD